MASGSSDLAQTFSWIAIASALFTFAIRQLTASSAELLQVAPLPIPSPAERSAFVSQARRLRAAKQELEREKRRLFLSQAPFRLYDLPTELILLILSHCASWPKTYASLARTSSRTERLTYEACLPHIPIRLITTQQVRSFNILVRRPRKGIRISSLVRHLWLTPLQPGDVSTCIGLIRACRSLRSLATNTHIVERSIELFGHVLSHPLCRDLTLLSAGPESWQRLLGTTSAFAFLQQVRRLRVIGAEVSLPKRMALPNLTHLSYGTSSDATPDTNTSHSSLLKAGEERLDDTSNYPILQCVIATKARFFGGLRISRMRPMSRSVGSRNEVPQIHAKEKSVWLVELPPERTEIEIWSDNAYGRGLWELC